MIVRDLPVFDMGLAARLQFIRACRYWLGYPQRPETYLIAVGYEDLQGYWALGDQIEVMIGPRCKEINNVGEVSTIFLSSQEESREVPSAEVKPRSQEKEAPKPFLGTDAMKEENVKAKNLGRLIKPIFETRSDGIQYFEG
ncbi:hypothetical protein Tco_1252380 [Tanacetum coccineum]